MPGYEDLSKRLQLKAAALILTRDISRSTIWWGFSLGSVVLLLRALGIVPYSAGFWLLLTAVPLLVVISFVSLRSIPSRQSIHALLDKHSGCGGLLVASDEMDLGSYNDRMPGPGVPIFRWQGKKDISMGLLAIVFLGACLAVPQRHIRAGGSRNLDVSSDVSKLKEQIKTLQEEDILAEQQSAELQKRLDQIKDEARGDDPVKTWESLDHVEQQLRKTAQEQAIEDVAQTEQATKAESLAKALSEHGQELSESLKAEAASELAESVEELAQKNSNLNASLSNDLKEALQNCQGGNSQLSKEQLEQLQKALQGAKSGMAKQLSNLQQAELIDGKFAEMAGKAGKMGNAGAEGLAAFLKENGPSMGVEASLNAFMAGPGKGGVNRGRGDAAMTWKEKSGEQGTKFEEQILPPASLEAMKNSKMVGVSTADPSNTEAGEKNVGGFIDSKAGTGQATKRKILPRHKKAVQKYFERENQ